MAVLERRLSPGGATQADGKTDLVLKPDSIAVVVSQAVQRYRTFSMEYLFSLNSS